MVKLSKKKTSKERTRLIWKRHTVLNQKGRSRKTLKCKFVGDSHSAWTKRCYKWQILHEGDTIHTHDALRKSHCYALFSRLTAEWNLCSLQRGALDDEELYRILIFLIRLIGDWGVQHFLSKGKFSSEVFTAGKIRDCSTEKGYFDRSSLLQV